MFILKTNKMQLRGLQVTSYCFSGYCTQPVQKLIDELIAGNELTVHGDFVLGLEGLLENEPLVLLYNSQVGATPWFYTCHNNQFFHGSNVFDIWKESGIPWEWSRVALYAINNLEHTIGELSIHPQIKRIPPRTKLIFYQGKLNAYSFPDLLADPTTQAGDPVEQFRDIVSDYLLADKDYFISLSAGMDSRLLLASLLNRGIRPTAATMGNEHCTDVKIAKRITRKFEIAHEHYSLSEADYFNEQAIGEIIHQTSGSKTIRHWHTYFFIDHFRNRKQTVHLAGTNGELVRSYYFNKGILSRILGSANAGLFRNYFKLKLARGDAFVIESLQETIIKKETTSAILGDAPTLPFMKRLDHFYTNQRVRHFTGNGVAIYNHALPTALPFLDERFIRLASGLPRKWKLNDIFHKKCIDALYPALMNFPVDENGTNIRGKDNLLYFTQKKHFIDYNIFGEVMKMAPVKEIILESPFLSDWAHKKERIKIWEEGKQRTISFLLTLHHISNHLKRLEKEKPVSNLMLAYT